MKFYSTKTSSIQHFRALSKKLGKMVKDGTFFQLDLQKQFELRTRLANLYKKATSVFSSHRLRRILASSAVLLGLACNVQAQSFVAPVAVTSGLTTENAPVFHFADIDGDGDQDAFFSMYGADDTRVFAYQENTGTAEVAAFGPVQVNPLGVTVNFQALSIDFSDVDNDGDLDLFISSYDLSGGGAVSPIYGWENTGTATNPVFSLSPATNPFNFQPSSGISEIVFADLDGDGDQDVLMNNYEDDTSPEQFRYQENLGIMGTFPQYANAVLDPFGLDNDNLDRMIMDLSDLDNDGDLDLMIGGRNDIDSYIETGFYYYENTGNSTAPTFAASTVNPFDLEVPANTYILIPTFVDIDGDGDTDIIATTYESVNETESVLFWENLGVSNVKDAAVVDAVNLYPTVADNNINWDVQMKETVGEGNLRIIDIHSRVMYSEATNLITGFNQGTISVADLSTGMYIFNVTDKQGKTLTSRRFFVN